VALLWSGSSQIGKIAEVSENSAFDISLVAEAMSLLGHDHRFRIIRLLHHRELRAGDIARTISLEQSLTSYHLRQLRRAGIVRTRRDGTWIFYSLDPIGWNHFIQPIREFTAPGALQFHAKALTIGSHSQQVTLQPPGGG
jgi:ArsR family transcriptional regulator